MIRSGDDRTCDGTARRTATQAAAVMSSTGPRHRAYPLSFRSAMIALVVSMIGSPSRSGGMTGYPAPVDGPLAPGDAIKSFRAEPGVRVELVAAEPMGGGPGACAFA